MNLDLQDDYEAWRSHQTVVTPKQSCAKRRLRDWELHAMPVTSLSITTPDSKNDECSSHVPLSSIVTHASDSDMEEMDDASNPYGHMKHQSECKKMRTDLDYEISSIHPDQWWKKKSRINNPVIETQHSHIQHERINDSHKVHSFRSSSSSHECHICQTFVSCTSQKNSVLINNTSFHVIKRFHQDSSKTKQKNSLLSYFNPTKSALSKASFHNVEGRSEINTTHQNVFNIHSTAPLCSYCDRVSCSKCCKICEQCQSSFCTFCYTVNYESNVEKIICFTCQDLSTSESSDMDIS